MGKNKKNSPSSTDEEIFAEHLKSTDWDLVLKEKERGSACSNSSKKVSRSKKPNTFTFDLHGLTLEESKDLLRTKIKVFSKKKNTKILLKIVTGRGLHSGPGGGVLCKDVHTFVCKYYGEYIISVDESPDEVRIGDVPLRGHFFVLLKF